MTPFTFLFVFQNHSISGKCLMLLSLFKLLHIKFNELNSTNCLPSYVSDCYLLGVIKPHPELYLLGVQLKFPNKHPCPWYPHFRELQFYRGIQNNYSFTRHIKTVHVCCFTHVDLSIAQF